MLSQNFIKYPSLVSELLDSSDIGRSDVVLEIGPGRGIITRELAKRVDQVIAVERDQELSKYLRETFKETPNVKFICQDFLTTYLPEKSYKVFANIPFEITAKIINKFLKSNNLPESMYLIMQMEAAEKYVGIPADTQSSIKIKPWYEVKILGDIDRTNFTLKPQVMVAFVEFKKRKWSLVKIENKREYLDFVAYGFSQWQPTVLMAFKKVMTHKQLMAMDKNLKIGSLKPSELSLENWVKFFEIYHRVASDDQKSVIKKFKIVQ